MDIVTGIIMAAVPSVLSGIVLAVVSKSQKKADEREEERNERERLTLESLNAIFCVTKELTECVLNGKEPNGELHIAYEYKQKAKHDLEEYERKRASK
ncbi:MAG: hypothetical protein Q4C46_05425 [Bacillota bacterium]|nr:hypothetical protein [Bacillota bacterium]